MIQEEDGTEEDIEYSDTTLDGDEKNEELNDDDVVYQITTSGADFDVDGLVKRFDRGAIYRPEFQRNFVWTWPQASKFIESILLGLPIPSVFLFREEETQKLLIVDGLQRLTTLHAFKKGRLPLNDRVFKLKDVKPRFEGKTLEDLDEDDQRRFEDAIIHAMIIQQMSPDDSNSSVFHIFERLNSNGTPLQPQEMRAAVYHGPFQEMLGQANSTAAWRFIFGPKHKRAKDQELILRFMALRFNRESYARPMKGFLNDFMAKNRKKSEAELQVYLDAFIETVQRCADALGKQAFRITRSMNVAFYDALMVAVAENPVATAKHIKDVSDKLAKDATFTQLTGEATSNEASVLGRISKAKEELDAATNHFE
ncbi:DUF262 domain-containing protein [Pseudotabrizicola alkalilacus]|uniref:DUF262 domain-containing protein n=1 Tax=Pseudotabrizicola alkalilacus TaxID=2305252 RepID=A0A411Z1D1_9RHOB|nr:DUF262 domain-containing protein [Pseudotabrizicola alkalilacus]RGP36873.1 DUF262 domain-containing protein [Pseudotabrizicola alkalilacus]